MSWWQSEFLLVRLGSFGDPFGTRPPPPPVPAGPPRMFVCAVDIWAMTSAAYGSIYYLSANTNGVVNVCMGCGTITTVLEVAGKSGLVVRFVGGWLLVAGGRCQWWVVVGGG